MIGLIAFAVFLLLIGVAVWWVASGDVDAHDEGELL